MRARLPDWSRCLFTLDVRHFAISGGRGSSKSTSVASALVVRATEKKLRILCAREIQNSIAASVKQLLDDEIARLGLGHFWTSTDTAIRGANGSEFIFAGLRTNIDSIKSMEGIDICWVEEAQTVSQTSLEKLIPTIRKPGSQFYWTWNPEKAEDPIEAMFYGEQGPPPRSIVRRVNWRENPWFPEDLRELKDHDFAHDAALAAHVWEGAYKVRTDAQVFTNWKVEEFESPSDADFRFGADWGFSVDPTVLVRCHLVGRKLYVDYEAYMVGCEIKDTPALFSTIPESEHFPIIADSARPETISHMRKHGFSKVMPARKGPGSVEEGVAWLNSCDMIVHPRCQNLIRELGSYSYKVDRQTGAVISKLADKDNHVIDALRYACESARRTAPKERPTIVPRAHASRF